METVIIGGRASVVGAFLGAFLRGLRVGVLLQKEFQAQERTFNEQLAKTKKELVQQFQEQLYKSKDAWMQGLETAKSEWLREVGRLMQHQETTSMRLAANEKVVRAASQALAVYFQRQAKKMGESEEDVRRLVENLIQATTDQMGLSDAD